LSFGDVPQIGSSHNFPPSTLRCIRSLVIVFASALCAREYPFFRVHTFFLPTEIFFLFLYSLQSEEFCAVCPFFFVNLPPPPQGRLLEWASPSRVGSFFFLPSVPRFQIGEAGFLQEVDCPPFPSLSSPLFVPRTSLFF